MKSCLPALLCASLFLLACEHEVTSSDLVRTRKLYGDFGASSDDSGETQVTARLLIDGANGEPYEELRDGDVLLAKMGDQTKTMQLDDGAFRASFDDASDGSEVNIIFNRTADDEATRSAVTLADDFAMLNVDGPEVRRGELVLHWEPFRRIGALTWAAHGDCIEESGGPLPDEGIYAVPVEQFRVRSGQEGESCTVEIIMTRTRDGMVDPALEQGGKFPSVRTRTFNFTSLPSYEELGIEPPVAADAGSTTTDSSDTDPASDDTTTVDTTGADGGPITSSGERDAGSPSTDVNSTSADAGQSPTTDAGGNQDLDASTTLDAGAAATDAAAP